MMSDFPGLSTIMDNPIDVLFKDVAEARRLELARKMAEADHEFSENDAYTAIKDAEDEIVKRCDVGDMEVGEGIVRMIAQSQLANTLTGYEEDE